MDTLKTNVLCYGCLPGEMIRAVFDLRGAGTGFLGITDNFVFEFRGGDKAHRAYQIIMEYLLV